MNHTFKGVFFDLDGTLLDTAEDLGEAMNAVLAAHQFPTLDLDTITSHIGKGIKEFVAANLPADQQNDEIVTVCYMDMQREYASKWKNHTKPYPHIPELLDELQKRNLLLVIWSNKEDEFTKEMVKTILPSWQFASVNGSTLDSKPKPNPDMAIRIAKDLNLIPPNFLYLGDSNIDMETAKISGMYAVWAKWGYGKQITYSAIPITDPLELLDFL